MVPPTGDTKKCPYCAEMIKYEAKVCRFCQRELATGLRSDIPAIPVPEIKIPQQSSPGVWSGVKLGCGMFIVLPLLILLVTCGGCGLLLKGCVDSRPTSSTSSSHTERDDSAELAAKHESRAQLAAKQKAFEAEQLAKGLVNFRGDWITPEDRAILLAEEKRLEE